jgi:SAM-dependent methyltransferase
VKKHRNCPICKSLNSRLVIPVALMNFDNIKFPLSIRVSECLGCGFIYNDNEIDIESLNEFYTKENFYFTENSFGTGGRDISRYETYLTCITPYLNHESVIIDVGCGKGQLVKYLIDKGFTNARGVELDKRMVEIATQQGIPVHEGTASKLSLNANSIDLLIYTHVFEHLWDLDDSIEKAKICLKNNGLMFIEVPNASNYLQARLFDYFWISMAEHINHFSDLYLELLMMKHGFIKIVTMETIVPYNNRSYGYPSLRMLFQRNETMRAISSEIEYSALLINKIHSYITNENEYMLKHKHTVNELKTSKTNLFVWGIGIEFFILSTFTDLLDCNILSLIDKNSDKQGLSVNGKVIVSPEHLKQATLDSVVLLTSVFNKEQMQKYLQEISFKGKVLVLD